MDQFADWKNSIASRNNLIFYNIPHIPIFVEDIPNYIAQDDYKQNRVKTIQTVGRFISESEVFGKLVSITPGNECSFPVSFEELSIEDIYMKTSDDENVACPIWKKYDVLKIYGTLKEKEVGHVLETYRLAPVHDVEGTWKLMDALRHMARSEYRRYYRTEAQNAALRTQLQEMQQQRKRHEEGESSM